MSTSYYDFSGHLVARSHSTTASLTATASGQTLTGTGANERLSDVSGGDVLVGGGGDDSFVVHDASTKLFEAPSGGVDSVLAYKDVALPANFEILGVGGSLTVGTGNSAGNLLIAWATRDRLEGGGDDVLVAASTGQTTFDFTPNGGHDVVYGFHATGASHDWLSLQGYGFKSFADLQPHIVQQGSDTLVNLSPTDAVLLRGVQAGALTADDFLLPFNASGLKQTFAADFNGPLSVYDPKTGQGVFTTSFNGQQIESGPNAWRSRTLPDNGEKEIYVDPGYAGTGTKALGVNPFTISDGVLDITARRTAPSQSAALNGFDYTSGLLTTRESFSQLYGYFEIRAQLPVAQGAGRPSGSPL